MTAPDNWPRIVHDYSDVPRAEIDAAMLRAADIPGIRARLLAGERTQDIAADYGISNAAIWAIKNNRTWRHV